MDARTDARPDFSATDALALGGAVGALILVLRDPPAREALRSHTRDFDREEWQRLAALAITRHRVGPLVGRTLATTIPERVPADVAAEFKAEARRAGMHALVLKAESARVVSALNRHGIEPVLFKGWCLEEALGRPIGERVAKDIDILVAPGELKTASEVLRALGYAIAEPAIPRSDTGLAAFLAVNKQFEFYNARLNVQIELHVRPFQVPGLLPAQSLCTESRILHGGARAARYRVLARESCFLFLALHGYMHGWERAKWLVDLPPLLRSLAPDEWTRISALARQLGVERAVGVGLVLARDLLGAAIPPAATHFLEAAQNASVTRICRRRLLAPHDAYERPGLRLGLESDLVMMTASRRPRAIASALGIRLVQTTDIAAWSIPDLPRWLYYALAALHLLRRAGRRLRRDILHRGFRTG